MTHALSLILLMATAQTAGQPAPVPTTAPVAVPAPVIVQYVPSDNERALRAQLDEARDQLARMKEESGLPDNAVAALLVSGRPELASLRPLGSRYADSVTRHVRIEVYGSTRKDETMVAVVVNLKNPRDEKAWEPTEAWVRVPFGPRTFAAFGLPAPWYPPKSVAVRSAPTRILPGQSARIVVVFDKTDLESADGPIRIGLQRDGKPEFEFVLLPSDFQPSSQSEG